MVFCVLNLWAGLTTHPCAQLGAAPAGLRPWTWGHREEARLPSASVGLLGRNSRLGHRPSRGVQTQGAPVAWGLGHVSGKAKELEAFPRMKGCSPAVHSQAVGMTLRGLRPLPAPHPCLGTGRASSPLVPSPLPVPFLNRVYALGTHFQVVAAPGQGEAVLCARGRVGVWGLRAPRVSVAPCRLPSLVTEEKPPPAPRPRGHRSEVTGRGWWALPSMEQVVLSSGVSSAFSSKSSLPYSATTDAEGVAAKRILGSNKRT